MKTYSDEELVIMAQAGEETAFTELYQRYSKRLEFVAYKLCKNHEDAKDAVQQTYIQAHTSLHTLRDPKRFYHWCCKIIHGKCTDMFRKNRDVHMDIEHSPLTTSMVEEREDYLPQKAFHFHSDRELLSAMIQKLPYAQRQVVLLVYFDNLSMQDCAAFLNIPEGTVKSRLFSAKKSLRDMISAYNETSETPLDFQENTIGAMIGIALAQELSAYKGNAHPKIKGKRNNDFYEKKAILFLSGLLVIGLIGAGVELFTHEDQSDASTSKTTQKQEPIQFYGKEINDSKAAYFSLRNWAVDERQMKNRSTEDLKEAKKLYEYLKENDDAYYAILIRDGWTSAFEALLK